MSEGKIPRTRISGLKKNLNLGQCIQIDFSMWNWEGIQKECASCKGAQYCSLSEKCKSKQQWGTIHASQNGCHSKVYKQ